MDRLIFSSFQQAIPLLIQEGISVDAIVVDPPYEIGIAGKGWDKEGTTFQPETWALLKGILKPDGVLIAFCHARTYHRMAKAIMDGGIYYWQEGAWVYGSWMPKGMDLARVDERWEGFHTALKPGHEPIFIGGLEERPFSKGKIRYSAKASGSEVDGLSHPTIKPVSLMEGLLTDHCGKVVLDCFAGSGTTGIAARLTGKDCILIERDLGNFKEMVKRITGKDM